MTRTTILNLMQSIVARRGQPCPGLDENALLAELGFRSLDFAELCLRVEEQVGHELNLSAGFIRRIETVGDVCRLLEEITAPAPAR